MKVKSALKVIAVLFALALATFLFLYFFPEWWIPR